MMATGKSSVGRRLADHYGVALFDSDEWIEARTGRTVREIWESDGVDAFRTLESEALGHALASPSPVVIAAAGGTVLDPSNRSLLAAHTPVVWLRAEVATIVARLLDKQEEGEGGHRPLLGDDPARTVPALDAARRPFYSEVADLVVDVDQMTKDEVSRRIAAAVDALVPASSQATTTEVGGP